QRIFAERLTLHQNQSAMEVLEKMLTYREFREMEFPDDDPFEYELLNGELVRKASPTIRHQRIVRKISFAIDNYLEQHPLGEVFFAPLDVVLDDVNAPQPDVFFVSNSRNYILDEEEQVVIGVPDLVVEIISPGSVKRDRVTKKKIYQQFAVPEFWLVDPSNRTVEVFRFQDGHYETFELVEKTGVVKSAVLPGFEVELSKIF
ncbi:MAG: Uma2 family endonuclease, partial [Bacteroidota bacterium]